MMLSTIQFQVDADPDLLPALRDAATAALEEAGATVVSAHAAAVTRTYRVHGVDLTTGEPFDEVVDAASADEASAAVTTSDRVVAAVTEITP